MIKPRLFVLTGLLAIAIGLTGLTASASADSMLTMSSYTDARGDFAARPGTTIKRGLYGPINVPANGQYHPLFPSGAQAPCTNCHITDVVPNLVTVNASCDSNDEPQCPSANLGTTEQTMLHHFVFGNPGRSDLVCPTGGVTSPLGERFFAAGNERTHMHLPAGYGYHNNTATWNLLTHLVNKSPTPRTVYVEVVYRYHAGVSAAQAVKPAWLDIDGCGTPLPAGDSEYSIPVSPQKTDYHDADNVADGSGNYTADWVLPWDARVVGISGHSHDIDINGGVFCTPHCAAQGGGIGVSAEVRGGPATTYYGPSPANNTLPSDLTGATLCRSETYYGTTLMGGAAGEWAGHLDTMSQCGIWNDLPPSAQAEAYPVNGQYPSSGFQLAKGQRLRLHSEYENKTNLQQNDVMGIMVAWVQPTYPRPNGAAKVRVTLVPAFDQCTSPNTDHGPPFPNSSNDACTSVGLASDYLTVPNTDATRANGAITVKVVCTNGESPPCPAAGEQENVNFNITVNDVRTNGAGTPDYGGQLQAQFRLRITDTDSGGSENATVVDNNLNVTVPCTTNSDPAVGSSCSVVTNANALSAGMVKENKRAIWAVADAKVFDGGSDGVVSTTPNTLFMKQGIFVP